MINITHNILIFFFPLIFIISCSSIKIDIANDINYKLFENKILYVFPVIYSKSKKIPIKSDYLISSLKNRFASSKIIGPEETLSILGKTNLVHVVLNNYKKNRFLNLEQLKEFRDVLKNNFIIVSEIESVDTEIFQQMSEERRSLTENRRFDNIIIHEQTYEKIKMTGSIGFLDLNINNFIIKIRNTTETINIISDVKDDEDTVSSCLSGFINLLSEPSIIKPVHIDEALELFYQNSIKLINKKLK